MRLEKLDKSRDLADAEQTITTNSLGPIRMINALVEHVIAQPDAAIVNVTSGLAFLPLTTTSAYSATKAAIHSYTISLRNVLKDRVELIELAPPAVQTGLPPGQEDCPGYLPLADFADEVVALFGDSPHRPKFWLRASDRCALRKSRGSLTRGFLTGTISPARRARHRTNHQSRHYGEGTYNSGRTSKRGMTAYRSS